MNKIKTLKKNYEFENVLKKGKFYIGKQIIIYITKSNNQENCIGIAISKKTCHAVQRNSLKRKIRENYRLISSKLQKGYHIVFVWNKKVAYNEANFHLIGEDMKNIFSKAGLYND